MRRNTALKILNPIILLLFVNQAVSVIFLDYYSLKAFEIFHKAAGATLLCLIAVHFILNFNWIKANYLAR